jgi:hypothetical protein
MVPENLRLNTPSLRCCSFTPTDRHAGEAHQLRLRQRPVEELSTTIAKLVSSGALMAVKKQAPKDHFCFVIGQIGNRSSIWSQAEADVLSDNEALARRERRENGEILMDIARSMNVSHSTISRL